MKYSSKAPSLVCVPVRTKCWFVLCGYVCLCVWPWLFVFFMCIHALCLCVCVRQSTNRESWALQGISCIITERFSEAGWILIEFCGVFHCLWSHSSEIRENFQAWCPSVSHTHSFSFSLPSSFLFVVSSHFALSLFSHFELSFPIRSFLLGFCLSLNPFLCLTLSVVFLSPLCLPVKFVLEPLEA